MSDWNVGGRSIEEVTSQISLEISTMILTALLDCKLVADGQKIVSGPRDADGQKLVSGPRDVDGQKFVSGPRDADGQKLVSGPQDVDGQKLVSGPRDADGQKLVSDPQDVDGQNLVSGPQDVASCTSRHDTSSSFCRSRRPLSYCPLLCLLLTDISSYDLLDLMPWRR